MPAKGFLVICALVVLGCASFLNTGPTDAAYVPFSILALLAFGLKLTDHSDIGFMYVIFSAPRLGWPESILIACAAMLIDAAARRRRDAPWVMVKSLALTAAVIAATDLTFHLPALAQLSEPIRLTLASGVCFVAYHVTRWSRAALWTLPYYLVAAAIATLAPTPVVLPALLVAAWQAYRLYERRLVSQRDQRHAAGELHLRTIEALALAIEAKDQPLGGRSRRVQI
jgi:hypothetical protein